MNRPDASFKFIRINPTGNPGERIAGRRGPGAGWHGLQPWDNRPRPPALADPRRCRLFFVARETLPIMWKPLVSILTAALALSATLAQAQAPLRIVVGYPPGGSSDRVARIVADKLGAKLGIAVLVENKTGAGGRLSAQYVKSAPAQQPTLLLANPAVMLVAPLVFA